MGTITLPDNYDDLEFFFDPGMANGATGRASVSRENITLADPDVDDFDAQFEFNDQLPVDDERLEDDVEVEVFRSAVVEAGGQLEDYDYAHDEYTAPNDDEYDGGMDDGFGAGDEGVLPLALDADLMGDGDDGFAARRSVGGESLFGGALPSIPGSSVLGDRPDDREPGPASKRRKADRVVVVDRTVTLSNDHIRAQLRDTRDIVSKRASPLEDDGVLNDPETLEASLRGRLMACDVGAKLNDAYRKASAACWGRPDSGEPRVARANDDDADAKPFTMNFDYADNENGRRRRGRRRHGLERQLQAHARPLDERFRCFWRPPAFAQYSHGGEEERRSGAHVLPGFSPQRARVLESRTADDVRGRRYFERCSFRRSLAIRDPREMKDVTLIRPTNVN